MPGPLPLGTMAGLPDTAPFVCSGMDLQALTRPHLPPSFFQFILDMIQEGTLLNLSQFISFRFVILSSLTKLFYFPQTALGQDSTYKRWSIGVPVAGIHNNNEVIIRSTT